MDETLLKMIEAEEFKGKAKWGHSDTNPDRLLAAATEELGEVAHAINHDEGFEKAAQEIAEVMGVLSRLYKMLHEGYDEFLKTTNPIKRMELRKR